MSSGWLPIETAPNGVPVLVASSKWIFPEVGMIDGFGIWYAPLDGSDYAPQPTHWQPLPEPPNAA